MSGEQPFTNTAVSYERGRTKEGKMVSGAPGRNCPRNNAVKVSGVTSRGVLTEYQTGEAHGIFESGAYRADIKTGHEAPWRRATLISRKHSAAHMPTGYQRPVLLPPVTSTVAHAAFLNKITFKHPPPFSTTNPSVPPPPSVSFTSLRSCTLLLPDNTGEYSEYYNFEYLDDREQDNCATSMCTL